MMRRRRRQQQQEEGKADNNNNKKHVMVAKTTEEDGFLQVHLVEAPPTDHENPATSVPIRMVMDLLNPLDHPLQQESTRKWIHLLRNDVQDRPDMTIVGLRASSHDNGLSQTWWEALTALQECGNNNNHGDGDNNNNNNDNGDGNNNNKNNKNNNNGGSDNNRNRQVCIRILVLRLLHAVMGISGALQKLNEAGASIGVVAETNQNNSSSGMPQQPANATNTASMLEERNFHLDCEQHMQSLFQTSCREVVMKVWRPILLWNPCLVVGPHPNSKADGCPDKRLLQSTHDVYLTLQRLEASFRIYQQHEVGPCLQVQKARRRTATGSLRTWTSWGIGCCVLWMVSSSALLPSLVSAAIVACATRSVTAKGAASWSPKTNDLEDYPHKLHQIALDLEHCRTLYAAIVNDLGLILSSSSS